MSGRSIPPRYIRSETLLFQDVIIRQLDRIGELGIEVGMNASKDAVMAYEIAIRDLHFLLYPTYTTKKYEEKVKKINDEIQIELLGANKLIRLHYVKQLQEWKGLIVSEFAQLDILPATRESLQMGIEDDQP